jgi:hypothetical protein
MSIPTSPTFQRFAQAPTVVLDVIRLDERIAVRRRRNADDVLFYVVGALEIAPELDVWSASRIVRERADFKRRAGSGERLALSSGGILCAVTEGVKA